MMVGVCSVCSRPGMNRCSMCGAVVCAQHYVKEKDICTACSAGKATGNDKREGFR